MATHPYPVHLVATWSAPDGSSVVIRPIRPEDAEIGREFVQSLSPEAKYMRFMLELASSIGFTLADAGGAPGVKEATLVLGRA